MTYAQKDYSEKLGNSEYTIAQAGSLLTAMSNLLVKFDAQMSPLDLDKMLQIADIDAARGLSWSFVSYFLPIIGVESTGHGSPDSDASIVELEYKNPVTDETIVAYCAVDSAADGTIIDSFDGVVKSWDVYGGPVSFASFAPFPALTISPLILTAPEPSKEPEAEVSLPTPPEAPQEPVSEEVPTYQVNRYLDGHYTSAEARDGIGETGVVAPGEYHVFNQLNGMINVTKDPTVIGLWINPAKNTELSLEDDDEPDLEGGIYAEDEEGAVKIPVKQKPWQSTFKAGLGVVEAVAIEDVTVVDIEGVHPDKHLEKGTIVPVAGKFQKGEDIYFRTKASVDAGVWYGVPRGSVRKVTDLMDEDDEFDDLLQKISDEDKEIEEPRSARDKIIKSAATAEGKVKRLLTRGK
jgi:hypothetical protein